MIDQPFLDLFMNIESREGVFLWLTMLVSFFLGFLIALLLRWSTIRRLKRELKASQAKEQALQSQLTSIQQQLQTTNAELQKENQEKTALLARVHELEQAREQQLQEVVVLNRQQEELQNSNRLLTATISDLNDQIIVLKTTKEELGIEEREGNNEPVIVAANNVAYQMLQARLNSVEARLAQLDNENATLRSAVFGTGGTTTRSYNPPLIQEIDTVDVEPDPQIQIEKDVLYDKIIVADRAQDDLTQIDGLGSFYAKKLNSIGVFTYEEIANWDDQRIEDVTKAIGYIPGRIKKDRWVEQAAILAVSQNQVQDEDGPQDGADTYEFTQSRQIVEDLPASDDIPDNQLVSGKIPTDLKVIEGIGPKIEKVLKSAGIQNWATLAATGPGQLKEILEEAGDRFRMHNPYTWPLQARLAAGQRWEELEDYQRELQGGKEK